MEKYIAPKVKSFNVCTQKILVGSNEPSVYNTLAGDGSEGLAKGDNWFDE